MIFIAVGSGPLLRRFFPLNDHRADLYIETNNPEYHGSECSENNSGKIKMFFVPWHSAIYERATKINLLMVVKCFKEKKMQFRYDISSN